MRYPLALLLLLVLAGVGCGGEGSGGNASAGDGGGSGAVGDASAKIDGRVGPMDPPAGDAPAGMVWVPGGEFTMGRDLGGEGVSPYEGPAHKVGVAGFWMDAHEVTNAQFAAFVQATGYVTVAEQKPRFEDFQSVMTREQFDERLGDLPPGGMVFRALPAGTRQVQRDQWWAYINGANWRRPGGEGTSIESAMDHPVVLVCWEDAAAYAKWAGKSLPTEAQWEFAARGGDERPFIWGDEPTPDTISPDRPPANLWQGNFPFANTMEDGHLRTAPVKSYPPNPYGLYDLAGNVREWCNDWWDVGYYRYGPRTNPPGPIGYLDPAEPFTERRVVRGGSYLHDGASYAGMRPSWRFGGPVTTAFSDLGFRCVQNVE